MEGQNGNFRCRVFALVLLSLLFNLTVSAKADKDPYKVLGLQRGCTPAEIRAVYKTAARKWHPDKNPSEHAKEKFIEIQAAYELLSNPTKRQDYDNYGTSDGGSGHASSRGGGGHWRGQAFHRPTPEGIPSATETLTSGTFAGSVLRSPHTWIVQVYSLWDAESRAFSPVWEALARELEGVAKLGRVELSAEQWLASQLAERDMFTGQLHFSGGMPAVVAFPSSCSSFTCAVRYTGDRSQAGLDFFVSDRLLRLPRIPRMSLQALDGFLKKQPRHKMLAVLILPARQATPPVFRHLAKEFRHFFSFGVAEFLHREAFDFGDRYGVRRTPSVMVLEAAGRAPLHFTGKLRRSGLKAFLENNRLPDLPQLRSVTAAELGCHISGLSQSGRGRPWFCLLLIGNPSPELDEARQGLLALRQGLKAQGSGGLPGVAFQAGRLHLAWLDASWQPAVCQHILSHNRSIMARTCGILPLGILFYLPFLGGKLFPQIVVLRYERKKGTVDSADVARRSDEVSFGVSLYDGPLSSQQMLTWLEDAMKAGPLDSTFFPKPGKFPKLTPEEFEPPGFVMPFLEAVEKIRLLLPPTLAGKLSFGTLTPVLVTLLVGAVLFVAATCFNDPYASQTAKSGAPGGRQRQGLQTPTNHDREGEAADVGQGQSRTKSGHLSRLAGASSRRLRHRGGYAAVLVLSPKPRRDAEVADGDETGVSAKFGKPIVGEESGGGREGTDVIPKRVEPSGNDLEKDEIVFVGGAVAVMEEVARHFAMDRSLHFGVVDSLQNPEWLEVLRNDADQAPRQQEDEQQSGWLLLWHPRRHKVQLLGDISSSTPDSVILKVEKVLDGSGHWKPATWPSF